MYCTQCGASIGEKEIRCPYCGAVNPFADEQKYMERLQKILQETEALSDEPMRQYSRELKQHGKRTLKIALAVGSVFVALALLFLGVHLWQNRQEASSARARLALEQQYIPRLDALYAEGNYEEAARLLDQAYAEAVSGDAGFISWDHSTFIYYYDTFHYMEEFQNQLLVGGDWFPEDLEDALCNAMILYKEALLPYEEDMVTSREKELIDSYKEEAGNFLREDLYFTEEEIEQLYQDAVQEGGYLDLSVCRSYADTVQKRLNENPR